MGKVEIAIKSYFFIRFTGKLYTIRILSKHLRKFNEQIFFGHFGASAEESKFSPDAKESDSPGALLPRAELCFKFY